jgi:hypothetical protein
MFDRNRPIYSKLCTNAKELDWQTPLEKNQNWSTYASLFQCFTATTIIKKVCNYGCTGECKRIRSPKIHPYTYIQVVFRQCCQRGKGIFFKIGAFQ